MALTFPNTNYTDTQYRKSIISYFQFFTGSLHAQAVFLDFMNTTQILPQNFQTLNNTQSNLSLVQVQTALPYIHNMLLTPPVFTTAVTSSFDLLTSIVSQLNGNNPDISFITDEINTTIGILQKSSLNSDLSHMQTLFDSMISTMQSFVTELDVNISPDALGAAQKIQKLQQQIEDKLRGIEIASDATYTVVTMTAALGPEAILSCAAPAVIFDTIYVFSQSIEIQEDFSKINQLLNSLGFDPEIPETFAKVRSGLNYVQTKVSDTTNPSFLSPSQIGSCFSSMNTSIANLTLSLQTFVNSISNTPVNQLGGNLHQILNNNITTLKLAESLSPAINFITEPLAPNSTQAQTEQWVNNNPVQNIVTYLIDKLAL